MRRQASIAALKAAADKRILIIDGAMGTMIQRYKLDEAGYRGARFADWQADVKGNNDLLVLTQPEIIGEIHERIWRPAPTSSKPTPSTRSASRWPTTAWRSCRTR